jgi:YD repeat-containing protein
MAYSYRSRDAQVSALTVNGVKAADVAYDAFGRVDSVTYPGGVTQSYSYDAQGRPTLVSMRAGQATWSHAVTRTPYGRILGEKLTRGTNTEERAYTYDPGTGRLARAAARAPRADEGLHRPPDQRNR